MGMQIVLVIDSLSTQSQTHIRGSQMTDPSTVDGVGTRSPRVLGLEVEPRPPKKIELEMSNAPLKPDIGLMDADS